MGNSAVTAPLHFLPLHHTAADISLPGTICSSAGPVASPALPGTLQLQDLCLKEGKTMFTKPRLWFATNTTAPPLLLRLLSAGTAHPTLPSQRQAETWFSLKLSRQCQQKDLTPCAAPQGSHMCTSADPRSHRRAHTCTALHTVSWLQSIPLWTHSCGPAFFH